MALSNLTSQSGSPRSSAGLLRGGSLVAGVEVSVLMSESHNLSSSITKLPMESGAQVTDHVILEPDEVSVVFTMTNASNGKDAARDAFETFKKMRDSRELIELATEHRVYSDMVIVGVSPMHQSPYKGALNVTIHLQQINFVRLQSVGRDPGSLRKGVTSKTASGKVNGGQQDPKEIRGTGLEKIIGAAKGA